MVECACCGMTTTDLRRLFIWKARIIKTNDAGLPVGKEFPFAFWRGQLVLIRGNWPEYFHGKEYRLLSEDVELSVPPMEEPHV